MNPDMSIGEIFTPRNIAGLMADLIIDKNFTRVLDPAVGEGIFLLEIIKKQIKNNPQKRIDEIIREIYGVDIKKTNIEKCRRKFLDKFEIDKEFITECIFQSDFFDLTSKSFSKPEKFDLIIGNPPYLRHEQINNKNLLIEKIKEQSPSNRCYQNKQADLYVYFIEYATYLLKEDGILCFIVPDKWLDVNYGRELKKFLLKNYILNGIIYPAKSIFSNAIIDNVIIILTKNTSHDKAKNLVSFIRMEKIISNSSLQEIIWQKNHEKINTKNVSFISQEKLDYDKKWSKFFRITKLYTDIINHPKITSLKNVANIKRGITSGADNFFYVSKKDIQQFNLPKRYLLPAVKSPKDYSNTIVVNSIAKKIIYIPEEKMFHKLPKKLQKYILWGEQKNYHTRESFKHKKKWYSLNITTPAVILSPRFVRTNFPKFLWNKINAIPNQTYYEVFPKKTHYAKIIFGSLISYFGAWAFEIEGRIEGRGLLQLAVFELANFPVIDPRTLTGLQKNRFIDLINEAINNEAQIDDIRTILTKLICEILNLSSEKKEKIIQSYQTLQHNRLQKRNIQNY
ncbi:MAG: N-6 DNA methylase [Asgard group archaeon]|nr:N-6 DNA methylase [Asgard group archaeon]